MAPKVALDRLKAVYISKTSGNSGTDRAEQDTQFRRISALVKDVYGYPLNTLDPGCLYEVEHLRLCDETAGEKLREPLDTDKHNRGTGLLRNDLRLVRAQEIIRDAYYIAYTSKLGFKGIGRPPELQQLVAATCHSIYGSHLLHPSIRNPSREGDLLSKLSPHLRVSLLAEVAAGILCPSQPLPPDTPQHADALYAFIYEAYKEVYNEVTSNDIMTLEMGCLQGNMRHFCELGILSRFANFQHLPEEWITGCAGHTHRLLSLPPPMPLLDLYMRCIRGQLQRHTAESAAASKAEWGSNGWSRGMEWTASSSSGMEGAGSSSSGGGSGGGSGGNAVATDMLTTQLPQQGLLWQGALRHALSREGLSQSSKTWHHLRQVILVQADRFLMDIPEDSLSSMKLRDQLKLLLEAAEELSGEQSAAAKVQAMVAMLLPEYCDCVWSKQQQKVKQQQRQEQSRSSRSSCSASGVGGKKAMGNGDSWGSGHSSAVHTPEDNGSSSSSSSYQDGLSSSGSADHVDHEAIQQRSLYFLAAMPLQARLVLAGLLLGSHLSLDAAALVWRFLEAAEQSGGPAWEEDVVLQVVLLLQEAQGLQQVAVQQLRLLAAADQLRAERLWGLQRKRQEQEEDKKDGLDKLEQLRWDQKEQQQKEEDAQQQWQQETDQQSEQGYNQQQQWQQEQDPQHEQEYNQQQQWGQEVEQEQLYEQWAVQQPCQQGLTRNREQNSGPSTEQHEVDEELQSEQRQGQDEEHQQQQQAKEQHAASARDDQAKVEAALDFRARMDDIQARVKAFAGLISSFQAANASKDKGAAARAAEEAAAAAADAKVAVAAADANKTRTAGKAGSGAAAAAAVAARGGGAAKRKQKHPQKKRQQQQQHPRKGGRWDRRHAKVSASYVELLAASTGVQLGFSNPAAQPYNPSSNHGGASGLLSWASSGTISKIASRAMSYLSSSSSSSAGSTEGSSSSSGGTSSSGDGRNSSSYNSSSCHLSRSRGAVADAVGETGTGSGRFCRFAAPIQPVGVCSSYGLVSSSSSSSKQADVRQQQQQQWGLEQRLQLEESRVEFAAKFHSLKRQGAAVRLRRIERRAAAAAAARGGGVVSSDSGSDAEMYDDHCLTLQMAELNVGLEEQSRAVQELMVARLQPLFDYQIQWRTEATAVRDQAKEQHLKREAALKHQRAAEHKAAAKATTNSSSSSSSGRHDRWWPWFRPDCPFCRKEVEELVEEERQQQQEQQQEQGQTQSAASAPAAAAGPGPAYYPWQETQQQQQQQQQQEAVSEEGADGIAAAAAGGGGGGDGDPLLHDSCYGAWPVPWDCPFKFRRLMWRLMARVKPMGLRYLAEQFGMCAHCGDVKHWSALTWSMLQHLWLPTGPWEEARLVHPPAPGASRHTAWKTKYAEALEKAFLANYDPAIPLLSAQVLLALGAGVDTPIPSHSFPTDAFIYLLPGSFSSCTAAALQQHMLADPEVRHALAASLPQQGLSAWAVKWHLGVREAAAKQLWQQQQQQGGQAGGEVSAEEVTAAVEMAYASADVRYQAVGYASRQLASACPLVANDLLDLLLPHQKAFFETCKKGLTPVSLLIHPTKWKPAAKSWSDWEEKLKGEWKDPLETGDKEQEDSEEEEGVEGVCRRPGCGKALPLGPPCHACSACNKQFCSESCEHEEHAAGGTCTWLSTLANQTNLHWRLSSLKAPSQPYLLPGSGLALKLLQQEASSDQAHIIRSYLVKTLLDNHVYNVWNTKMSMGMVGKQHGGGGANLPPVTSIGWS